MRLHVTGVWPVTRGDWVGVLAAFLCVLGAAHAAELDGRRLYLRHCAPCHGVEGRGDGPDAGIFAERPRDLRTGFLTRYTQAELVQRVQDGTPLNLALDPVALRARTTETEALVGYMHRLPHLDWPRAGEGRDIYVDRCAPCHGPYGNGARPPLPGAGQPRDLAAPQTQRSVTDTELLVLVRHGHAHMPGLVPRITDGEARALVAFVRQLSPGFELYDRYCASCHGEDGRGVGSFGEAMRLPTVVFDSAYFARRDPDAVRSLVWHMAAEQRPAMPHYRYVLTTGQAAAIIAYLQREAPGGGSGPMGPR